MMTTMNTAISTSTVNHKCMLQRRPRTCKQRTWVPGWVSILSYPLFVVEHRPQHISAIHIQAPPTYYATTRDMIVVKGAGTVEVARRVPGRETSNLPFTGAGGDVSYKAAGVVDRQVGHKGVIVLSGLMPTALVSLQDAQKDSRIKYRCLA